MPRTRAAERSSPLETGSQEVPLSWEYADEMTVPIGVVWLIVRRPHPWSRSGSNSSVVTDPATVYLEYVAVTSCTLGDAADGGKRSTTYWREGVGGAAMAVPQVGSGAL